MAIRHKRKNSAGYTWQTADLVEGQLGMNIADGTLHFKKANGNYVKVQDTSSFITDVIQDTTPQLGGDLDVNGKKIVSASNTNISLEPNGTGKVTATKNIETTADVKGYELWATSSSGDEGGQINLAQAVTNSTLAGDTVTVDIYQNKFRIFEQGGDARGVYIDLTAAAAGVGTNLLSGGGGITDIVQDTTPQLGGDLDVNGKNIVSTSNANVTIAPNGTGKVVHNAGTTQLGTGAAGAVLTSSGANNLLINTNNGTSSPFINMVNSSGNVVIGSSGTGRVSLTSDIIPVGTVGGSGVTITSNGVANLTITTNDGTESGSISIPSGLSQNITIAPASGGRVHVTGSTTQLGTGSNPAVLTTNGANNLTINTNNGTNSGSIVLQQGLNGNITLSPNGSGDVYVDADTLRVGDSGAAAFITSNGAGNLNLTTGGAANLILSTNSNTNSGSITINNGLNGNIAFAPNGTGYVGITNGQMSTIGTTNLVLSTNTGTNSGTITINQGLNANIVLAPNGTGDVQVDADTLRVGDANAAATITSNGTGNLVLNTNSGTNSGSITINQGANGNIAITPNGTGVVDLGAASAVRITGGSSGQFLSTNGSGVLSWATAGGSIQMALATGATSFFTGTKYVNWTSEDYDANNLITVGSNGTFTISNAGTYLIQWVTNHSMTDPNAFSLYNVTGAATLKTWSTGASFGTTQAMVGGWSYVHTITGSTTYRFECPATGATGIVGTPQLMVIKIG